MPNLEKPYTIVGIREVSFEPEPNKIIKGVSLFVTYPRDGVLGVACDKFFVSNDKVDTKALKVGSNVAIYFNRYSKVDTVITD